MPKTKDVIKWVSNRFREPSTYAGLFAIISAVGIQLSDECAREFMTAGVALAGMIGILTKD